MRKILFAILLLISTHSFSQLNFRNISFEEAVQSAAAEGKLIFLQYESVTCKQCNEVADKAFQDQSLASKLYETFICIKITPDHPDRKQLGDTYNKTDGFGSLFINQEKTLIHNYPRSTTRAEDYKQQIDIALQKAGESLKLDALEKEYKKGNKSIGLLEEILLKRKSLNLSTDALLEEYVTLTPADSSNTIRTLQFIARMAPVLSSKANIVLRRDQMAFNKSWYSLPVQQRVSINNMIIYKSMSQSVKEKNEAFAKQTASFAQSTHNTNYTAASKAYDANMLHFYESTGDTTNYFEKAIGYYDRYLMSVSVDSIQRMDSMNKVRLLAQSTRKDTINRAGNQFTVRSAVSYSPLAQNFTRELNTGAANFYKLTNNPYLLSKAKGWAKRGLAFMETPEALDTYAKLLYKTGEKEQAIVIQSRSIALRKQRGFLTKEYDVVLEKMQKNLPLN